MEYLDFSELTNQLSDSQYDCITTLLQKLIINKLPSSYYRPTILLNCDCKTRSKAKNNRLEPSRNELAEK